MRNELLNALVRIICNGFVRIFFSGSLLLVLYVESALAASPLPSVVRVDYADFNPLSFVLKKIGWLEKEFQADNVGVEWFYSSGSNLALEHLNSGTIDFASAAGLSSVLSRAKGNPIKAVYIFSHPEWLSLVVTRDSPITAVSDLKGKRIAATPGTDPWFFLLRALSEVGLHKSDVMLVPLPHSEGRAALEHHKVDAWAGGDPYSTSSQLESGSRVIYRNIAFNSNGFLNISESFAAQYPDAVLRVIKIYERVRRWAIRHPDELALIYADEAGLSLQVASVILSKVDFSRPVPGADDINGLKSAAPILLTEELVEKESDLNSVVERLVDPGFASKQVRAFCGKQMKQ
ncbi:aliphatic sulfonate ABC transporter substrate-binding protein [Chlorobium ferrooxidans]|uniref:Putative aliphatic sulfonates-binding protein n=1 Tax=Chlorobium ferrooxidans DSM 13031 TaxID=377431 RepID=Q0YSA6_9CHLB|nr:aliphatic sulfonate ABC transporter substrate-binding protein [Chlorobium ferrooxidans]EAT59086.1 ABC transporter, substrate-binding protein, aliphatic sulphonates [Chlorobium ferrooxidans DSM 13031]